MDEVLPLEIMQVPKYIVDYFATCCGQRDSIDIHHHFFQLPYLGIEPGNRFLFKQQTPGFHFQAADRVNDDQPALAVRVFLERSGCLKAF